MKLIAVEAEFPSDRIEEAVVLFENQAATVRAMDGCEHYALYRAGSTVAIFQRWRTMNAFDAYRASDTFATLGQGLKPMMTKPPTTTIAEIDG